LASIFEPQVVSQPSVQKMSLWASGNAGERAALAGGDGGVGGARLGQGAVPVDGDEGVDLRVAGSMRARLSVASSTAETFSVAEGRGDVLEAGVDHMFGFCAPIFPTISPSTSAPPTP
jgi:hypothetical protein